MNALVWNARGLGSSRAFHELRRLLTTCLPMVVFICETKVNAKSCEKWKRCFGFDGLFAVDATGRSGWLVLMWKFPAMVSLRSYSKGHIDSFVDWNGKRVRFTGFYGNPSVPLRRFSWDLLRRLANDDLQNSIPWIVGGDFNEICYDKEKKGGGTRPFAQMNNFCDAIMESGLSEFENGTRALTWRSNRNNVDAIWERLDRFLSNDKWREAYPSTTITDLDFFGSDHKPLLCRFGEIQANAMKEGMRRFHFEEKWFSEKSFVPDFLYAWNNMARSMNVTERMKACQDFFKKWAGNRFDNLSKKIASMRARRASILAAGVQKNSRRILIELEQEINILMEMEESHWFQRSRANWMAKGDKNTPTFHAYASVRKKRNQIKKLIGEDGSSVCTNSGMAVVVDEYFRKIFTSSQPNLKVRQEVTNGIKPKLSVESVALLSEEYTREEVYQALFSMHPSKSPGIDGLSGRFYQKFWPEIGDDLTDAILGVLNRGDKVDDWNKTLIVLIPKTDDPVEVKNFRPISLCNTIYKVVSKVITTRLKKVLHEVVDENQSAFVAGRQITDNIIVAFESMHWIRNKGKNLGYAALKLDMSKAYDRVEWAFLEEVLGVMNFPQVFIKMIMSCITTVSYSYVVNGRIFGNLTPSRGIRQGDPLSPLLFVLCAQGFSSNIHSACSRGDLRAVVFGEEGPHISHLFFADDSMVFFKADERGCMALKECINKYEIASGQLINFEKSAVAFSGATKDSTINMVCKKLGVKHVDHHNVYLGLPTVSCRKKRLQFGFLRDRALKKLSCWKNKFLSAGGKEVLIKSIIQAIPTYAMQCFRIPVSICVEIERACANFWWGKSLNKKSMHWGSWKKLCKPKSQGGMGFRDLASFNNALLAKQVWRAMSVPESLMARVLQAKYFPRCSLFEAKIGNDASFIWRSLCSARPNILKGLSWKVGDGENIRICQDKFIPGFGGGALFSATEKLSNVKVKDFFLTDRVWNTNLLVEVFGKTKADFISRVEVAETGPDLFQWSLGPSKNFRVKYGYLAEIGYFYPPEQSSSVPNIDWNNLIWKTKIPPKCKIFLWRLLREYIATPSNLLRHHVPVNGRCESCRSDWGSSSHVLYGCKNTKHIWKNSEYWEILKKSRHKPMVEVSQSIRSSVSAASYDLWVVTSYFTWLMVCGRKHETSNTIDANLSRSDLYLKEYKGACDSPNRGLKLGVLTGSKKWAPPSKGVFRLDVGIAADWERDCFGFGVVIRDWKGDVKAALATPSCRQTSTLDAELCAIMYGVGLSLQEDLGPVEIYSNSILAVRILNEIDSERDSKDDGCCRIQELRREGWILNIRHMYQSVNALAFSLAQYGANCNRLSSWNGVFPPFVESY